MKLHTILFILAVLILSSFYVINKKKTADIPPIVPKTAQPTKPAPASKAAPKPKTEKAVSAPMPTSKSELKLTPKLKSELKPEAKASKVAYRDIFPDTWVGTDALGRKMPDYSEVGNVKTNQRRVVGIFYITWHDDGKNTISPYPYSADVTKILKKDPKARFDAKHPLWKNSSYHWGEPELGYFLSKDKYVIRMDISMLADAGVDVLIMDVTNAVRYWKEWKVIFEVMQKMKAEGNKVPKFCFWAFNGPVITVVQDLYDKIYKVGKYKDLWFYWDGKPLLLYNGFASRDVKRGRKYPNPHYDPAAKTDPKNPHFGDPDYTEENYLDYTKEVKNFFTLRTMWWGYYKWGGKRFVGTEDNWSFGYDLGDKNVGSMNPGKLISTHKGKKEEAAVTPAQHASSMIGKSWTRKRGEPKLNEYDLPISAYVPWLGKTVKNPEAYGIYFQKRWDETLKYNPQFLYLNDWNEWTAGKYQPKNNGTTTFMGRKSPYFFVDQYNAEFTRCIQPMKGGYTDNYYMQMAQNLRKYKGVRPIPILKGINKIVGDGKFDDWNNVKTEYRDTIGDTIHRDYPGYGGLHYTNDYGRNDIITCKVAVDYKNIYFFAQTKDPLTPYNGKNWMLLLIDADNDTQTGWYGYDFLINKSIINNKITTLKKYDAKTGKWIDKARIPYKYDGNKLELAVPRNYLGLTKDSFTFDFHWVDNPADLKDPISLCTNGDSAPNRRFNYRCIWKK